MSKKNPQKSTRNKAFNRYISNIDGMDFINSSVTVSASSTAKNIILNDYNDYIIKSGADIVSDANSNHTMKDHGYKISIDVSNIDSDKNDYYIYGAPYKYVFDNHQLCNNCGPVSVLNVLVTAGLKTISNQTKTEYDFTRLLWELGLVEDAGMLGVFDTQDGGTTPASFNEIFEYYNITSKSYATEKYSSGDSDPNLISLVEVANIVRKGGAAIVGVNSTLLWGKGDDVDIINHAVTVTGVVYGDKSVTDETVPVGFYIHDTGGWMSRYISYDDMVKITYEQRTDVYGKDIKGIIGTVITDPIKQATDNINATGNEASNIIYGNKSDNTIKGMQGDDTLVGGAGNDKIYGGAGNDIIYANDKSETGGESLGRNIIYGNAGDDTIYGGNYNDLIYGGAGKDYIFGNKGIDAIYGGAGSDSIYGGDGDDRLLGEGGNDYIEGDDGSDTLIGGSGNDTIIGGLGIDRIECGSGSDVVIYNQGDGADVLTSTSGSVTIQIDKLATDLNYEMELNEKTKKYSLFTMMYSKNTGIDFQSFYNQKNNTCKTTYIKDSEEEIYRIYATKSKGNISVKSPDKNNILFALSTKNKIIKTSENNDFVYMMKGKSTITYTGGKDYYTAYSGDNTYVVDLFNSDTSLFIDDYATEEGVESNDILKLNASLPEFSLFFNMYYSDGDLTVRDDLYILDSNFSQNIENYVDLVKKSDGNGLVSINDYFGTGNIETVQIKAESGYDDYNISAEIAAIKQSVLVWFRDYGTDYTNVFEAFSDGDNTHLAELVSAYTEPYQ